MFRTSLLIKKHAKSKIDNRDRCDYPSTLGVITLVWILVCTLNGDPQIMNMQQDVGGSLPRDFQSIYTLDVARQRKLCRGCRFGEDALGGLRLGGIGGRSV